MFKNMDSITEYIRKRGLNLLDTYIERMDQNRIAKTILNRQLQTVNKSKWIKESAEDLKQLKITVKDITDLKNLETPYIIM